ncbi:MAG: cation transporter [Cyclobacteriaceae bacterium]
MLFIAASISSYGQDKKGKGEETVKVKTSAICEMCKEALEHDLAFEKGVKNSNLNLDDKVLTIVYNPKKTSAEKIRKRITMVGYNADSLKRDPSAYKKLPFCCKDGGHHGDF